MTTSKAEHIDNKDVHLIYDSAFKKLTKDMKTKLDSNTYFGLNEDTAHLAYIFFNKFKIQFYTALQLTFEGTTNPNGDYEYLDIASIHLIIRSCLETYLLFNYIYMQPNCMDVEIQLNEDNNYLDLIEFKYLLYRYDSNNQMLQAFSKESGIIKEKYNQSKKAKREYKCQIKSSSIFTQLSTDKKEELLKLNGWKPSWNKIALNVKPKIWNPHKKYNLLSQFAHTSYSAISNLNYYYQNIDDYDKNAVNLELFQIGSLFFHDIHRIFHVESEVFSEDEINLLSDFLGMATQSPAEILGKKNYISIMNRPPKY